MTVIKDPDRSNRFQFPELCAMQPQMIAGHTANMINMRLRTM
jgi:hypothetical protein